MSIFRTLADQAIRRAASALARYAIKAARKELREQGHYLTGGLEKSMTEETQVQDDAITSRVSMNAYFTYLQRRLPSDKVPYSRGSGAKSSKAVEGLLRYWKLRGLAPKEARSATFATLNKWKQEGRPTRASFRYAKNGRRTGFLEYTVEDVTENAARIIAGEAANELEKALLDAVRSSVRASVR